MHPLIFDRLLARLWERWAERGTSRFAADASNAQPVHRYNGRYRWTLAAGFILLVSLCVYAWTTPEAFQDRAAWVLWFVRAALTVTVVIGAAELAHAFRFAAYSTTEGLVVRRAFGKRQLVRWSNIDRIVDDPEKRELRIIHADGESRISYQVHGVAQLRERFTIELSGSRRR
ncbi:MAG TPA: hypothetical protein VGF28_05660 [Thermoanaerobaculia bacterium]|jgi:hypothetical protein